MTDIETLRIELLKRSKVLFDSIESQLNYREKYYSKYRSLNFLTGVFLFLFIISIIPLIPLFTGDSEWIIKQSIIVKGYAIPFNEFYIRWIVFTSFTGIIYFPFRVIDKYFDKKENMHSISISYLSFAYLYKSIKELEVFLVNDRKEHTSSSLKYLKIYFQRSFLNYTLNSVEKRPELYLPELLGDLNQKYNWIEYTENTRKMIKSFNDIESKIYERINQRKEIDAVIETLKFILSYEYILLDKVKIEKLPTPINDDITAANLMLTQTAEKIENLLVLEPAKDELKSTSIVGRFNKIGDSIASMFTHKNLLVTFFAWFILLGIIFSSLIYLGQSVYKINIDSTIYIGSVSGIILGSITISATIYSKNK
jgi:hypothetical protein